MTESNMTQADLSRSTATGDADIIIAGLNVNKACDELEAQLVSDESVQPALKAFMDKVMGHMFDRAETEMECAFRVYGIRRTPSGVGDTITVKWAVLPSPQSNE